MTRDFAELGLAKVSRGDGSTYVVPEAISAPRPRNDERLRRILSDIPVTVGRSGLIHVLTGQPGTANVIGQAIDEATVQEQVGTVAGDNTLIVLFPDEPALLRWLAWFEFDPGVGAADARHGDLFVKKVVLAYSGGLDTSVAVAWLREQHGVEVVTLTVDVGGGSLKEGVADRAMSAGASRAYVVDGRETASCATSCSPASRRTRSTRASTRWPPPSPGRSSPSCSSRSPTASGRTRSPTAAPARATTRSASTSPSMRWTRSWRSWRPMRVGMGLSREQEVDYAHRARHRGPGRRRASPYSIDQNLWGRSIETGVLEDPWMTPPADVYEWTVDPGAAPAIPTEVTIGFEGGIPVSLDGERDRPVELVERLNALAGRHGVGPDRPRRGPAGGHQEPRDLRGARGGRAPHGARGARGPDAVQGAAALQPGGDATRSPRPPTTGCGSAPSSATCCEYVRSSQRVVNGQVRLRLDHGNAIVAGRRSDDSLYDRTLATYDAGDAFDHAAAVGFIRIFGLPLQRRRPATARSASTTVRPGRGRTRCWGTCR